MPIPVAVPDATSVGRKHLGWLALPVAQLALLQVASDQPRQLSRGGLLLRENRIATFQVDPRWYQGARGPSKPAQGGSLGMACLPRGRIRDRSHGERVCLRYYLN